MSNGYTNVWMKKIEEIDMEVMYGALRKFSLGNMGRLIAHRRNSREPLCRFHSEISVRLLLKQLLFRLVYMLLINLCMCLCYFLEYDMWSC